MKWTPDQSSAFFSEDRLYRYELRRWWAEGKPLLWVMLNPSTADEVQDDPTVNRCVRFSQRWGYPGLVVCNIFALRATDPKRLRDVDDPVGPRNDETIMRCVHETAAVVCAWGVHGGLRGRGDSVLALIRSAESRLPMCLGTTKEDHPKHPLYLPNSSVLRPYNRGYQPRRNGER
jgi:hypothetical protein